MSLSMRQLHYTNRLIHDATEINLLHISVWPGKQYETGRMIIFCQCARSAQCLVLPTHLSRCDLTFSGVTRRGARGDHFLLFMLFSFFLLFYVIPTAVFLLLVPFSYVSHISPALEIELFFIKT